jgi:hypothetical protein
MHSVHSISTYSEYSTCCGGRGNCWSRHATGTTVSETALIAVALDLPAVGGVVVEGGR